MIFAVKIIQINHHMRVLIKSLIAGGIVGLTTQLGFAATLSGKITDSETGETLIGVAVAVSNTTMGCVTDFDGNYMLNNLKAGTYTIRVSYLSYESVEQSIVVNNNNDDKQLDLKLVPKSTALNEVVVAERKNLESERSLINERKTSVLAIENIGATELSSKGISNAEEGVKKISGVSVADAGQLVVRGLGDRYSTTTLNSLPIASPNPDKKLIPLNLFPSATIKNITISKVYDPQYYADYSGAHVDIGTKEQTGDDFFNVSLSIGGNTLSTFKTSKMMDRDGSLFNTPRLKDDIKDMKKSDFRNYVKQNDIFNTSFDVKDRTTLPDFGGTVTAGKTFRLGTHRLDFLVAGNIDNSHTASPNSLVRTLEATGNVMSDFNYDSYGETLLTTGLGNVSFSYRAADRIAYSILYSREVDDNYMYRYGTDEEGHNLIGSNNTTHIYSLLNQQLIGHNEIKGWTLDYGASYGMTESGEPDRRQVMYERESDNSLSFFRLNQQETMRYFGELNEDELSANAKASWKWDKRGSQLIFGMAFKNKTRDYDATRFYYNVNGIKDEITSVDNVSNYINQGNIENGTVIIDRNRQPKDRYDAKSRVAAAFVTVDWNILKNLLLQPGVRVENSLQQVNYSTDGGQKKRSTLDNTDLFPALNVKYTIKNNHNLRLSASRTVTRPSFIEMAPFLYQEAYGAVQIRGNENLQNGYNYNVDLRYEYIDSKANLLSATPYIKILDNPIERIQELAGGSAVHSFRNADMGLAMGLELEAKVQILKCLKATANASLIYTNVKLPEDGGAYTNSERSLQGASPYLVNADLTYTKRFGDDGKLTLTALYNLQGPRIHAVGISGLGDVVQKTQHTLNAVASYDINKHFSVSLKADNILNQAVKFEQEVPSKGKDMTVEEYKEGVGLSIGAAYKL